MPPSPGEGGPAPAGLVLEGVAKCFRDSTGVVEALAGVQLSVERGRFVTIIGPSGCGKSTLLRIAAGLVEADAGGVTIFGESPRRACAAKHVGFVPQSPALLPWRTVLDNVRLPLQVNTRAASSPRAGARDPEEILDAFGLGPVKHLRPAQLSGGMRQRVAIARAFAFDPEILLMDEPFSSLDEMTREVLRHELLDLWQARRKTVLFVTHSVTEAVLLSDVVAVMTARPGRIGAVVPVGLPRPRGDLVELTDEFRAIERRVRLELRDGFSSPLRASPRGRGAAGDRESGDGSGEDWAGGDGVGGDAHG